MEIRENLELIEVTYKDKKATLIFLDEETGSVREVNFNKQSYDKGKFVDDPKKEKKVEEWCKEYFNLKFENLTKAVGEKKTVYCYDNFNSLWESEIVEKFDKNQVGEIFETEIKEIINDGKGIRIKFERDEKTYESKMMYSRYVEVRREWFVDPLKKRSQFKKFKEKFGVSVENAEKIVGKKIMVEVKLVFGKSTYAEIKKPNWK